MSFMDYKRSHGFTLIELIMVMVIMGSLSVVGAGLMSYLIQHSVFIPNQLNMDMVASDALEIMIEGDDQAKGLRFSRVINAVQNNQVTFINQNNQTVRFRFETVTPPLGLFRSINAGAEARIPYYLPQGVAFSAASSRMFTYYDASEAVTNNPANVRWVTVSLRAQTGDGTFANWAGKSDLFTGIAVRKLQ